MLHLGEWQTFYVIVGSSAAQLTGLQFVVIALSARGRSIGDVAQVEAFGTPTLVHFGAVLTMAAIMCIPGHTAGSLSFCLGAAGALGVAYAVTTTIRAARQKGYEPVLEDWLWHAGFPIVAYSALLLAGIAACQYTRASLYVLAATALCLLFIGIHNAWDAAVYISVHKRDGV
jgi:hypothetical protein